MWGELRSVFELLSRDALVRAIVLSGAGERAFTAGLDVVEASGSSFLGPSSDGGVDPARVAWANQRHIAFLQSSLNAVEACAKPVACVLHGIAYGLAMDLSACADVRLAAADARFCVKEIDIGLAADLGTLSRLPKIVGSHSWVKDVCLTARIFDAREALQVGYVSQVLPSKEAAVQAALRWAALVAEKSPVAVQGTKELLNYSREHSVADGLRYTGVWNAWALQANDTPAAIKAGLAKRKATFEKL